MKTTLCLLLCVGGLCLGPSAVGVPPEAASPEDLMQPMKIIQKIRPAFPAKLLRRGITSGEVRMFLDVDANGILVDQLIVGYTHREFADVIEDAVRFWAFLPAKFDGREISSTVDVLARFEVDGLTVVERPVLDVSPTVPPDYVYHALEASELDTPLKAQRTVSPVNPARYGDPLVLGRAEISFFVDPRGRVRMPVVISADDERLGWAAVSAMDQWRFDPPVRKGKEVLVRATQVFRFDPPSKH